MAHSPCIDVPAPDRRDLLTLARASINYGFRRGGPLPLAAETLRGIGSQPLGSFVTLTQQGVLRGCMGSIMPTGPLAAGVAGSAYRAAFADPRFAPLDQAEFRRTHIEISVLSAPEPLRHADEADLLAQLRPHEDGLILQERRLGLSATFLPKVWAALPDPRHFLGELKRKAGLPAGYWSDTLRVDRYRAVAFGETADIEATALPG